MITKGSKVKLLKPAYIVIPAGGRLGCNHTVKAGTVLTVNFVRGDGKVTLSGLYGGGTITRHMTEVEVIS